MRTLLIAALCVSAMSAHADEPRVRKTQKDYGISGSEHVAVCAEPGDFLAYRVAIEADRLHQDLGLSEKTVHIWVSHDVALGYEAGAKILVNQKHRTATIWVDAHSQEEVFTLLKEAMKKLAPRKTIPEGADRV